MPNYNFKNTETGEEFEEFFTNANREKYLEENPHIQQLPSMFSMVGGHGDRIAEAHPGSPLASRYGKESTKNINTRNVLKKHKVL